MLSRLFLLIFACVVLGGPVVSAVNIRLTDEITIDASRETQLENLFGEDSKTPAGVLNAAALSDTYIHATSLPVGFDVQRANQMFLRGYKKKRNMYLYAFDNQDHRLHRWTLNPYTGKPGSQRIFGHNFDNLAYDARNDGVVVSKSGGQVLSFIPFNEEGELQDKLAIDYDASSNPCTNDGMMQIFSETNTFVVYESTGDKIVVVKYVISGTTITWTLVEAENTALDGFTNDDVVIAPYYFYATLPTNKQIFVYAGNDTSTTYTISFGAFNPTTGAADYSNTYSNAAITALRTLMARQDEAVTSPLELLAVTDTKVLALTATDTTITVKDTLTWEAYANAQDAGEQALTKCKGGIFANGTDNPAYVACQYLSGGVLTRIDVNTTMAFASDAYVFSGVTFTDVMVADQAGNFLYAYASDCGTNSANVVVPCIVGIATENLEYEETREFRWRTAIAVLTLLIPVCLWVAINAKDAYKCASEMFADESSKKAKRVTNSLMNLIIDGVWVLGGIMVFAFYGM